MNIPVSDQPDLVRDSHTKAILCTDVSRLHEHRQKKKLFESLINGKKESDEKIHRLESDISEIKNMMNQLLLAIGK